MDRGLDSCPGVLRPHLAADGAILRLRFPGGRLRPEDWQLLAELATDFGDGDVHLTNRGNVQVRGVDPDHVAPFGERVAAAGHMPSPEHDRMRNIIASPLAGRVAGRTDLGDLPARLDAALLARPGLAELPGRFLFGLDDSSGDVLAQRPDLGAVVTIDGAHPVVAGTVSPAVVSGADVPELLADLAQRFVDERSGQWRIEAGSPLHLSLASDFDGDTGIVTPFVEAAGAHRPPVGWVDAEDGTVSLLAVTPFGVVPARLAEFLAAIERPSTVSADKVIGVHELTESMAEQVVRVLAPMGLVFDENSPWVDVTACTGLPGCAKSHADVRGDVERAIAEGTLPIAGPQHWVGCERGCGDPGRGPRVTAQPGGGYSAGPSTR